MNVPVHVDRDLALAGSSVLALLAIVTVAGLAVKSDDLNARVRSWWWMCAVFGLALLVGPDGSLVLFGILSFLALREYVTIIPTPRADHRLLFWTFFLITPLEYVLVGLRWPGFVIAIPVYAFLLIPAMMALRGNVENFIDRAARIQWGLMLCVYCLSYAPALLMLQIPAYGSDAKLLFFLVVVDQLGSAFGRRLGRVGWIVAGTAAGAALWWLTPFTIPVAAGMSLGIAAFGVAGAAVVAAMKRGRAAILDQFGSLLFAAPVFYNVVRFFYGH